MKRHGAAACWTQLVPDTSNTDPPQGIYKPVSKASSSCGKHATKMVHISLRTERKSARNSPEDHKVGEGGREGPSGAGPQISLHSTEKNTFEQVFPAADGGAYHSTCTHCGDHGSPHITVSGYCRIIEWFGLERTLKIIQIQCLCLGQGHLSLD